MKRLWPEENRDEFNDSEERRLLWIGAAISTLMAVGVIVAWLLGIL